MNDSEGVQFLQQCLPRLRLIWPGYRKVRRQVYKRLTRRMESLGAASLADYRAYLETHPEEWEVFDAACWISISRFYRDKGVFQSLEQEVLPELASNVLAAQRDRTLRCWSIGCASGEEPYTLVLQWKFALEARFPEIRFAVLATDVDPDAIARAQRGCYSRSSLKDLPEAWRAAFTETAGGFCLKPEFREPVTFLIQDIRKTRPDERFHLVLCRYLAFTYFDEDLQRQTVARIAERMVEGGALVLGNMETLPTGDTPLVPWPETRSIYRYRPRTE